MYIKDWLANTISLNTNFGTTWRMQIIAKLWEVFQIIFTLSHGQAALEKGFLINNRLMVENIKEESLTASRFVHDSEKHCCSFQWDSINPQIKTKCSRSKDEISITFRRSKKTHCWKGKSRKRKAVQDKIRSVESKRKHSIYEPRGRCISRVSWIKLSFIFLAKSNAFGQKIHESEANEQSLQTSTQFEGEANVYGINKIWSNYLDWLTTIQ